VGRAIRRYAEGSISWGKALRSEGVVEDYLREEKGESGPFPWDGIVGPVTRESLYRRFRRIVE